MTPKGHQHHLLPALGTCTSPVPGEPAIVSRHMIHSLPYHHYYLKYPLDTTTLLHLTARSKPTGSLVPLASYRGHTILPSTGDSSEIAFVYCPMYSFPSESAHNHDTRSPQSLHVFPNNSTPQRIFSSPCSTLHSTRRGCKSRLPIRSVRAPPCHSLFPPVNFCHYIRLASCISRL